MRPGVIAIAPWLALPACSLLFDPNGPSVSVDSGPPDASIACTGELRVDDVVPRFVFEGEGSDGTPKWLVFRGCELAVPEVDQGVLSIRDAVTSADGTLLAVDVSVAPQFGNGVREHEEVEFRFTDSEAILIEKINLDNYNSNDLNAPTDELYSGVTLMGALETSQLRSMSSIIVSGVITSNGAVGDGLVGGLGGPGGFAGGMDGEQGGDKAHGGRGSMQSGGGGGHVTAGFAAQVGGAGGTAAGDRTLLRDGFDEVSDSAMRGGHGGGSSSCDGSADMSANGGGGGGFIELTARGSIVFDQFPLIRADGGGVVAVCGAPNYSGGSGAGGAILLRARSVTAGPPIVRLSVRPGTVIVSGNGGGGSGGRLRVDVDSTEVQSCVDSACVTTVVPQPNALYRGPILLGADGVVTDPSMLEIKTFGETTFLDVFEPRADPLPQDPAARPERPEPRLQTDASTAALRNALEPGLQRVCLFVEDPDSPGNSAGFVCPDDRPYCRMPLSGNCYDVVYLPDAGP